MSQIAQRPILNRSFTDRRMHHSFFALRSALVIRTIAVWILRPAESAARSSSHPARDWVQSTAYNICSTAGRDSSSRSSWVQRVLDGAAASRSSGADSLPGDTLRRLPASTTKVRPAANESTAAAVATVPVPRLFVQSNAAKLCNLAGSSFDAAFGADLLCSVAAGSGLAAESSRLRASCESTISHTFAGSNRRAMAEPGRLASASASDAVGGSLFVWPIDHHERAAVPRSADSCRSAVLARYNLKSCVAEPARLERIALPTVSRTSTASGVPRAVPVCPTRHSATRILALGARLSGADSFGRGAATSVRRDWSLGARPRQ